MSLLPETVIVYVASFLPGWALPPLRLSNNTIRRGIDNGEVYLEIARQRQQYEDLADSCLLGTSIETLLYLRRGLWQQRNNNGFRINTYSHFAPRVRCTAITRAGLQCNNVVRNAIARCHHHQLAYRRAQGGHLTYYVKYKKASLLRPPIFIPTTSISPAPMILTGRL